MVLAYAQLSFVKFATETRANMGDDGDGALHNTVLYTRAKSAHEPRSLR